MLDIDDYRAALAIFEHRHFGRASSALGITQPSLTARLKRMEERLGARLFHRNRGGVEPTAAGIAFVEAAEDVVRAAQSAERRVRDAAAGLGQVIRIGFTQLAAQTVAVPILMAFRETHPQVRLRLVEAVSPALEVTLDSHALDAAFLHPPVHTSGLRVLHLHESVGKRVRLNPETPAGAVIGYPQADAPITMSNLGQELGSSTEPGFGDHVATTVLGALVLSRAGYGEAVVPTDYEHPLLHAGADIQSNPVDTRLMTAIASRATDRRDIMQDLFECATNAKPLAAGAASASP